MDSWLSWGMKVGWCYKLSLLREERIFTGDVDFLGPIPGEQQEGGKVSLCS